jgi:hypothetical protein
MRPFADRPLSTDGHAAQIRKHLDWIPFGVHRGRLTYRLIPHPVSPPWQILEVLLDHACLDQLLLLAVKQGERALVDLLLACGADPEARDQDGKSALALTSPDTACATALVLLSRRVPGTEE